jgi:DNA topoisomerase-3
MEGNKRKIYDLIVKRFLAAFYPHAEYNTVKVETEVEGEIFVKYCILELARYGS